MNNDMMMNFIKGCLNEKGNKRLKSKLEKDLAKYIVENFCSCEFCVYDKDNCTGIRMSCEGGIKQSIKKYFEN